jgi:endonuclease/exonuclease/phosphatase family metal-dependent hydrolase
VIVTRTVDSLAAPSPATRQTILDAPVEPSSFEAAFATLEALHAVEVCAPPHPIALGAEARIVFWNAERLKYAQASQAMLAALNADVLILCELDLGMARTGNRHTIADLASSLGAGFVFGAEFVELGLGDLREQEAFAGKSNAAGLHGAGFVSKAALSRPALLRLETSGRWFDGAYHERRVGGRIAMLSECALAGRPVVLACAHYESHTDPVDRFEQTRVMLDAIDEHAPAKPVLIGGDFNTSTFTLAGKRNAPAVAAAVTVDPKRLVRPEPYEPMFELLEARGYDWSRCNVALAPTQRTRPDGTPPPPFGKIDWLFSRGLRCSGAAVIAAVDADDVAISDHEALVVTVYIDEAAP